MLPVRSESDMPPVSEFFGIVITINYSDRNPPHFHATYQGRRVMINMNPLAVAAGSIHARALGMVLEWAALHQSELEAGWERASGGQKPARIAPLD